MNKNTEDKDSSNQSSTPYSNDPSNPYPDGVPRQAYHMDLEDLGKIPAQETAEKIQDIENGLLPGQVTKPWVKGGISPRVGHVVNPQAKPAKLTNRQQRERELLLLLRKIKPSVSEAIYTAVKIMRNEEAAHSQQLRAATIILDNYRKLTLDLHNMEKDGGSEVVEEEDLPDIPDDTPVFSLRVINDSQEGSGG